MTRTRPLFVLLLLLLLAFACGGCGLLTSGPCEDAQTLVFLAKVRDVTDANTRDIQLGVATDDDGTPLDEEEAHDALVRNQQIQKRIAMALALETHGGGEAP